MENSGSEIKTELHDPTGMHLRHLLEVESGRSGVSGIRFLAAWLCILGFCVTWWILLICMISAGVPSLIR